MLIKLDIMFDINNSMSVISNMRMAMSYREKLAWTSLLATLLIWGWFTVKVSAIGFGDFGALLWLALKAILVEIVVKVAIAVALAVQAPAEVEMVDEREKAIALRAASHGFFALNAAVFGIATAPLWLPEAEAGVAMGVAALLAMAFAEVVQAGSAIIGFRRA
jgi:hypothetical protein